MTEARRSVPLWRRRSVLSGLVLLALHTAVFGVYTLPRMVQERTLSSRKLALQADTERLLERLGELRGRAEAMASNARDDDRFFGEVVGSRVDVLLPTLEDVVTVAQDLGLRTGPRTVKQQTFRELPVQRFVITQPVSGSYRQLVEFLDRIERSPRFLIVDAVMLRNRDAGTADLDVSFSAYYRAAEGG